MIDMIRWLHLSDLHLGSTDMSTDMMRDELPEFLTREGLKCDYVFCTGDIKTAAQKTVGLRMIWPYTLKRYVKLLAYLLIGCS